MNQKNGKTQEFFCLSSVQLIPQLTCDLTPISIRCQTTFCWTKFFWWRKYLSKTFFRISGLAGSGKPGASQLDESLGQEESNDTSNMRIGPAVPATHPLHYSYFNPIHRAFNTRTFHATHQTFFTNKILNAMKKLRLILRYVSISKVSKQCVMSSAVVVACSF